MILESAGIHGYRKYTVPVIYGTAIAEDYIADGTAMRSNPSEPSL
jgi:hypothetical protein